MGCSSSEGENRDLKKINVRQINLLNDKYITTIKFNLGANGEFTMTTISSVGLGNIFLLGTLQNGKSAQYNDISKLEYFYNNKNITNYFINNIQAVNLESQNIEIIVKEKN